MRGAVDQEVDTYSLPAPGEALWLWLQSVIAARPECPAVHTDWIELRLPQIRAAADGERPARRPGRPRRDPIKARDVALAWDIEGFRSRADGPPMPWSVGGDVIGVDATLGVPAMARAVAFELDSWDSRTVRRWRDDGRQSWASLGAWPWALSTDGKLSRVWWKRPEYAKAIAGWTKGAIWQG